MITKKILDKNKNMAIIIESLNLSFHAFTHGYLKKLKSNKISLNLS